MTAHKGKNSSFKTMASIRTSKLEQKKVKGQRSILSWRKLQHRTCKLCDNWRKLQHRTCKLCDNIPFRIMLAYDIQNITFVACQNNISSTKMAYRGNSIRRYMKESTSVSFSGSPLNDWSFFTFKHVEIHLYFPWITV